MNFSVLKPLFYFVFVFFSSSFTYDLNDVSGNYPYCLTASKEKKPSNARDSNDKFLPFTYLGILAANPRRGNAGANIKPVRSSDNSAIGIDDTNSENAASTNDMSRTRNQMSEVEESKPASLVSNLADSESSDTDLVKRSVVTEPVADMRDKMYQLYQDMSELDDQAKSGRVSVDHKVCDEHEDQKVNKEVIVERKKRMLGRKRKHNRHPKKENQMESKSKRKKKKKILRKLMKKKAKSAALSAKNEKETPDTLTLNNRTRRRIDSKVLFDMLSLPLEKYAESKKTEEIEVSDKIIEKDNSDLTENNIGVTSDTLDGALSALQSVLTSKTKEFFGENFNKPNNLSSTEFMNMIYEITNEFLGKKLDESSKKNLNFEISDIALKPKDRDSIVYHLNRNVAIPHAQKLNNLYGTQSSIVKFFQPASVPLTENKENLVKYKRFDETKNALPENDVCTTKIGKTTTSSTSSKMPSNKMTTNDTIICIDKCKLEKCLEQARIQPNTSFSNEVNTTSTCSSTVGTSKKSTTKTKYDPLCDEAISTQSPRATSFKSADNSTLKNSIKTTTCNNSTIKEVIKTTTCDSDPVSNLLFEKIIKDTKTTTCIDQFPLKTDGLNVNNLNEGSKKTKRQALPLKLLPILLKNDIEQPTLDGQSKKILLYLNQVNSKDYAVDARENDWRLASLFKSNPHLDLFFKDGSSIKKLLAPTCEIGFPGKKDLSAKEIFDLFRGTAQKNSKITDSNNCSLSKINAQKKLSLRDKIPEKSNVSSAAIKPEGPGVFLYNPLYRISFTTLKCIPPISSTTNNPNCSTNIPQVKSSTARPCPICNGTTMKHPGGVTSKTTKCTTESICETTAQPTTCTTSKIITKYPKILSSTECSSTDSSTKYKTHSKTSVKTTTADSNSKCHTYPICPSTVKCPTCPTVCYPTTTCPTKIRPSTQTVTCPTTVKYTATTVNCKTSFSTDTHSNLNRTKNKITHVTTTCPSFFSSSTTKPDPKICTTTEVAKLCQTTDNVAKKSTTPKSRKTPAPAQSTTTCAPLLKSFKTISTTIKSTTKLVTSKKCTTSHTTTEHCKVPSTKRVTTTTCTTIKSTCSTTQSSKRANPITCVFVTTCGTPSPCTVTTVCPSKAKIKKADHIEDNWETGENTASCDSGDGSKLIEYWKDLL